MKLLGSTKSKITKDENGKDVPHSEITEAVLVRCSIINNDYQHDSRIFYTVYMISLLKFSYFLKLLNSEFSDIEVWFTDKVKLMCL